MTLSTNSTSVVLRGAQEPRLCTRPPFVASGASQECIDLADAAGVHLDPWQQMCVHVILARAESGLWAALEAAILVARQNGKGEILLALELYWMFLTEDRLIVHTAHEFKTSNEAFLRLKAVLDNNPWMTRRVKRVIGSHGEEGVELVGGCRLRFLARSLNSGRGFTGDKVILDEAQQLPVFAMDALMPTLSARPNPQIVYAGTVPSDRNDCEHWTRVMQRGRAGTARRLAWLEWNIGEKYRDYDDRDAWVAANPALGYRMNLDFIEAEREALSHAGFGRERLNLWSMDPVDMVIPMEIWDDLVFPESQMEGPRAIAIDCPPGLDSTVIVAMGRNPKGQWHGEVVERHVGTDWVAVRVAEIVRKNVLVGAVVVDPSSPAGALIPDLEAEGVDVMQVTSRQHAQAFGMFMTRCMGRDEATGELLRGFAHLGDPILTDALKRATTRPGPEGTKLWNRREATDDISPIVALTLAGYGLSTMPDEEVDPWGFMM